MTRPATKPSSIDLQVVLQRKDPRLPVYIVIPHASVAPWELAGTTVVEGSVNGHEWGRRNIKRWDASARSDWFLELTAPFCKAASIGVGDRLDVSLQLASTDMPAELASLLDQEPALRTAWEQQSAYTRRTSQEHVLQAKSAATRERRATAIVDGLRAQPRR